jgi:hypothetical protein
MSYAMSRTERLERWAEVLEQAPMQNLTPFRDVEFLLPQTRTGLHTANSPLAVAYNDPVLRREGLPSDRFGDGADFFELSPHQAHRILCSCGYFGVMRASEVARRIRMVALRRRLRDFITAEAFPAVSRWIAGRRPLVWKHG